MLKYLKEKGQATEDVLNQRIFDTSSPSKKQINQSKEFTLLDLCIEKSYRSGLKFLYN